MLKHVKSITWYNDSRRNPVTELAIDQTELKQKDLLTKNKKI